MNLSRFFVKKTFYQKRDLINKAFAAFFTDCSCPPTGTMFLHSYAWKSLVMNRFVMKSLLFNFSKVIGVNLYVLNYQLKWRKLINATAPKNILKFKQTLV